MKKLNIDKIRKEFKSRETEREFRNAVRMRIMSMDKEALKIIKERLIDDLSDLCCIMGMNLEQVELFEKQFDYGTQQGFAYDAKTKKNEDARDIRFIAKKYEDIFKNITLYLGEAVKCIEKLSRKRKIKIARNYAKKSIKAFREKKLL